VRGLPFTSVETYQKIWAFPWKPVSYGNSNKNLKACKLRVLKWKLENKSPQIFWQVFHGSLSKRESRAPQPWYILALPWYVPRLFPLYGLGIKNSILMDQSLSVSPLGLLNIPNLGAVWIIMLQIVLTFIFSTQNPKFFALRAFRTFHYEKPSGKPEAGRS